MAETILSLKDARLSLDGNAGRVDILNGITLDVARGETLGLIGPSEVTITRGERKQKVDGFALISEEKLRGLDDAILAGLVRRGVTNIFAAHQMSLANFTDFGG